MDYCSECGNDITRQRDHDPSCYLHPNNHMPYCDWCGAEPTVYWLSGGIGTGPLESFTLCVNCGDPQKLHAKLEAREATATT